MMLAAAMIQLRNQQRAPGMHRFRQCLQARNDVLAIAQHGGIAPGIARVHPHRFGDDDAGAAARDFSIKRNGPRMHEAVLGSVGGGREPHDTIARDPGADAKRLEQAGKMGVHRVVPATGGAWRR